MYEYPHADYYDYIYLHFDERNRRSFCGFFLWANRSRAAPMPFAARTDSAAQFVGELAMLIQSCATVRGEAHK